MAVEVIVGPPNSGRAGEVRDRVEAALGREPVLVVPTGDDAAQFERDLCANAGAVLGVSIRTFASLFDEAAKLAGVTLRPALSAPQRLALVRAAVRATDLRLLGRSSARPGFAPALVALIEELQAALVAPGEFDLAARAIDDGEYEHELAALYASYTELRDRAGRSDEGSRRPATIAALRERPEAWGGRPVFVYGFDDLTRAQLELIGALATGADVVVAVNYRDRDALKARATLLAQLRSELDATVAAELEHDSSYAAHHSLAHLDAHLFEPGAVRADLDGGVVILESAGELGEAEAVGGEIARLLAAGEAADSIVVVVRDPDRRGAALGRVLERLAIPVAVEARASLGQTAVGRSLASLCRAVADDDPAELLVHLRADPSTPAGIADRLELRLHRERPTTVDEALEGWQAAPRHLAAMRAVGSGPGRLSALAAIARALAEAPFAGTAPLGDRAAGAGGTPFDPVEQRAAVAAAELLGELADVGRLPGCGPPDLLEAATAIESAAVRLWRGPSEGRVRIVDPYRMRAGRARHLFCAGLQDGEFPRRSPGDPLLGDDRRRRLEIAALARRDPLDEERYLFHACVSRPTERLYLCWQSADDEGAPAARSPFIDEVLDLLGPDAETAAVELTRRRGIETVVFAPGEAPTERELLRSQALAGPRSDEQMPGPLRVPAVLEALSNRSLLSASTLEAWLGCPYRWFVEHELAPERLDPESDALQLGGVAHDALEALYREPPGEDSIPRPGDLDRWRTALAEQLEAAALAKGMDPAEPADAIALARLRAQIDVFLREESELETDLRPRPDLLEAGFGFGERGAAALDLGDAELRGRIDRIDVAPDGRTALVRDYKTSREVFGRRGWASRGKLQLQLYILAARERLGLDPIGGLYTALGGRDKRRPRGITIKAEPHLEHLSLVGGDPCEEEDFNEELELARDRASEEAKAIGAGRIGRKPIGDKCPSYCTFQPICRLERALGLEDADGNGEAKR